MRAPYVRRAPQKKITTARVWYVSYGSNLNEERLRIYLEGGRLAGTKIRAKGARDPSPPARSSGIKMGHRLFFSGHSTRWGGAPAFLHPEPSELHSLGRAYDITWEQFEDIAAQENGRRAGSVVLASADFLNSDGILNLDPSWRYNAILYLGEMEGLPLLTISTTRTDVLHHRAVPSQAYLDVISAGLRQTYPAMSDFEIETYFAHAVEPTG
ncbi:MAG: hypothetical protein KF812_09525 [Fimbriimonadaceae bacterium]|nr:hypothetical protein [Fimbriimonadaceae bacterium]